MTDKVQAKISAWVTGVTGFVGYVAALAPEQQDTLLGAIVAPLPLAWRPEIGLILKAVSGISLVYGLYKAAHSGPQTDPATTPTKP